MHDILKRNLEKTILDDLSYFPATAILGPRQCGKSTLALQIKKQQNNFLYLDLENHADLNKLNDIELFFEHNQDKLICIDEIQRKPNLFPQLRSIIDRDRRPGKLLILGSASGDLLKQSSESLAGRISYNILTPFTISELAGRDNFSLNKFWERGGFPASYLAPGNGFSIKWRTNYIRTFFEQDIPQLGISIPSNMLRRFFTLCAHTTGQVINFSKMGEVLGLSHHTIKKYIDLLSQTFIVRILPPYFSNVKKRLVKSPKLYIRDSGLLHTLLDIEDMNQLMGHPVFGQSWEAFAIENVLSELNDWTGSYYRTSNGAEIDLILEKGLKKIAVEFKASTTPKVSNNLVASLNDLGIPEAWIISPIIEGYDLRKNIHVSSLEGFIRRILNA